MQEFCLNTDWCTKITHLPWHRCSLWHTNLKVSCQEVFRFQCKPTKPNQFKAVSLPCVWWSDEANHPVCWLKKMLSGHCPLCNESYSAQIRSATKRDYKFIFPQWCDLPLIFISQKNNRENIFRTALWVTSKARNAHTAKGKSSNCKGNANHREGAQNTTALVSTTAWENPAEMLPIKPVGLGLEGRCEASPADSRQGARIWCTPLPMVLLHTCNLHLGSTCLPQDVRNQYRHRIRHPTSSEE